ncbi:MAG: sigma-54 dependent transcriptional regulator [Myxococcota bacterium]|jgi:two-component system response regulator HydG|nr:sigma-54 dependent transcriptional regulator [Myxococcota bacterium]
MKHLPNILVVDDEASVRYTLRSIFEEEGWSVQEAADGQAALDALSRASFDLVVTDLRMPRLDGLGLLRELKCIPDAPKAIVVTAHGSEKAAVEAMKLGALDYFPKPFDADQVVHVLRRAMLPVRLAAENQALRAELALARNMTFESDSMRKVALLVERAARRDITVLLTGESGTGKELVARALVKTSPRANKPFVVFNCAAIPRELAEAEFFGHSRGAFTGADKARKGLFREANGGTLFLDEVGELDLLTQGALLRVLQEREVRPVGEERSLPVDVRVLAATNRNLAQEVEAGRFRTDLYYRLNVVCIHIPPLRERREDIVPLATSFARRFGERFGMKNVELSERVLQRLHDASWPGNVRELEHVVERLVALSTEAYIDEDPFTQEPLSADSQASASLKERVAQFEKQLIREELERCGNNHSETARRLQLSRITLLDKLDRYGLR